MNKKILIVMLLWIGVKASAQYGGNISYLKPSGHFGYYFKPTLGVEFVIRASEIDEQLGFSVSAGYYALTPRKEVFYSYGLQNGSTVVKASTSYQKYYTIPLTLTLDYRFSYREVSPIVAMDGVLHLTSRVWSHHVPGWISSSNQDNAYGFGFTPRAGVAYTTDRLFMSMTFGKNLMLDYETFNSYSTWVVQAGLIYYTF